MKQEIQTPVTTREKIDGLLPMSLMELRERISLTIECPPCFIDYTRKNGFAWYDEENGFSSCIGVAVALVGQEPLSPELIDRSARSELLGWEWSYLMHFEMAINALFRGDIRAYNFTGYFPKITQWSYIPVVKEEKDWFHVYKALV